MLVEVKKTMVMVDMDMDIGVAADDDDDDNVEDVAIVGYGGVMNEGEAWLGWGSWLMAMGCELNVKSVIHQGDFVDCTLCQARVGGDGDGDTRFRVLL